MSDKEDIRKALEASRKSGPMDESRYEVQRS